MEIGSVALLEQDCHERAKNGDWVRKAQSSFARYLGMTAESLAKESNHD